MALRSLTNLLFHFSTNRPVCNHYFGLRVEVLRLGRKVMHFDPVTQLVINDEAANQLINEPMRGPWKI